MKETGRPRPEDPGQVAACEDRKVRTPLEAYKISMLLSKGELLNKIIKDAEDEIIEDVKNKIFKMPVQLLFNEEKLWEKIRDLVRKKLEMVTKNMGDYEKVLFFKELSRLAKEQPEIQKKLEEKGIRL